MIILRLCSKEYIVKNGMIFLSGQENNYITECNVYFAAIATRSVTSFKNAALYSQIIIDISKSAFDTSGLICKMLIGLICGSMHSKSIADFVQTDGCCA